MFEKPSRRGRTVIIGVLAALVLSVPTAVWASHQFTDVPDSHLFHTGISWMKDHNITVGCNPPANTKFCPDDNVTRGQMATFMKRLAENNVVDAATLDGEDSVAFTTQIDGVSCESTCPDGASTTVTPILSLSVDAPAAGILQISHMLYSEITTPTNDIVQAWVAIDQTSNGGCGGWFFVPTQSVPGTYALATYDGQIEGGSTAGSVAVKIPAGAHTLKLCGLGSEAFLGQQGSLSTIWSQNGTGQTALALAGPPANADIASLKETLGDVAPQN
jgi:hypothetical protein